MMAAKTQAAMPRKDRVPESALQMLSSRSLSLQPGRMRQIPCLNAAWRHTAVVIIQGLQSCSERLPEMEMQVLLARAAEQGNAHAQFRLGVMYEQGQGVRKNEGKALIWLRKAADQGNDDARSRLSCIEGNGSAPIQKNRPVSSASGFFGSLFGF